jgi:hypothetical protein
VGRKTASVVHQTAVETPHFVRRDLKRINVRTIICCVGTQIQDVLGLFRHLHKILMTDFGSKKLHRKKTQHEKIFAMLTPLTAILHLQVTVKAVTFR